MGGDAGGGGGLAAVQPDRGGGAEARGQDDHEGIHRDPAPPAPPGHPRVTLSRACAGAVALGGGQPVASGTSRPAVIGSLALISGFCWPAVILGFCWPADIPELAGAADALRFG